MAIPPAVLVAWATAVLSAGRVLPWQADRLWARSVVVALPLDLPGPGGCRRAVPAAAGDGGGVRVSIGGTKDPRFGDSGHDRVVVRSFYRRSVTLVVEPWGGG